jgi:hypothetical protein
MKTNKLAAAAILQLLIFAYFWAIGCAITGRYDVTTWPEWGRMLYVLCSAVLGTAGSIAYLKNDHNEPGK